MSQCTFKRIPTVKLCTSDLKHKITIQTRTSGGVPFGENEPIAVFTTIFTRWAAIESVRGSSKFAKVSINDSATDLFYLRYEAALAELEVSNNWILFDNKQFRILSVNNVNRQNTTLIIQCTDRGADDKEAATG